MNKEVADIIQKKRFRRTWEDYLIFWEFLIPVLVGIFGIDRFNEGDFLVGGPLIVVGVGLTIFLIFRATQLNQFVAVRNSNTRQLNFDLSYKGLKNMRAATIETDLANWTLNAKCSAAAASPLDEWLTIVCLDNAVLVNSRPAPAILIFWWRRSALNAFRKYV